MSKNRRAASEIVVVPIMAQSGRRIFVGFNSIRAPEPSTRHPYEKVNSTYYVRHQDFLGELEIVFFVLQQEAQTNRRRGRWSAQKIILRQFIADCTHLDFET